MLRDRLKSMGMFPDIGKLTDMFDAKFGELIIHIDALGTKLDDLLQELRTQRGAPQ